MMFERLMPGVLAGVATSALAIVLPGAAGALTGVEINDIAREVTVLIAAESGHGSGFIVSRDGDTYYVLTAYHVVEAEGNYKIITPDKKAHAIDYKTVNPLPQVDLALFSFKSKEDYEVATLSPARTSEGQEVFVSGWPAPGAVGNAAGGQLIRQFTSGSISGFLEEAFLGYQIVYTNVTRGGMSGGPVFDAGGRVIGVHGLGDKEDPSKLSAEGFSPEEASTIAGSIKPGFNYAIPIATFLELAPQAERSLEVSVDESVAPPLGAPYVASQPDERDTIDDINTTLDTVNRVFDTIDRIRRPF